MRTTNSCLLLCLFTDDSSFGYASQDENKIKYVINHDLRELGDWPKRLVVSFNQDKTEIMIFKNVENSTNHAYSNIGRM
jgi:ABC-type antimicrobial peptide transport system ATPase subunit